MRANRANSVFLSTAYQQETGEGDWKSYQVIMSNGATPLTLRTSECSSNTLAILDNASYINQGDYLYLSNDQGNTIISSTVGEVSTGVVNFGTANVSLDTAIDLSASFIRTSVNFIYTGGTPCFYNYDGTRFYTIGGDSSTLIEFSLSTPGDISTMTLTGKTIGSFGLTGFDFSVDGKYIYKMNTSLALTIERLVLDTPWDISTVNSVLTQRAVLGSSNINGQSFGCRTLKISHDGTKIVAKGATNASVYGYTLQTPWDLNTIVNSTYTWVGSVLNSGTSLDISPDGKVWYGTQILATNQIRILVAVAATPWDARSLNTAITKDLTGAATLMAQQDGSYGNSLVVSGNGKHAIITGNGNSNGVFSPAKFSRLLIAGNQDFGLSKYVDISGFNLGNTVTHAWMNKPAVYIATAPTVDKLLYDRAYLDASNTTDSTATVNSPIANFLQTGDTVILNGNDEVILSNVVETSNAAIAQNIGDDVDYIKYHGRNYNSGVSPYHIAFTRDGRYLYIAGTSTAGGWGIYQYILDVAWDITTARPIDFLKTGTNADFHRNYSTTTIGGFDINPDGSSFIIGLGGPTFGLQQFTMSEKNNLSTAKFSVLHIGGGYTTSANPLHRAKFNQTGTQIETVLYQATNASQYLQYMTLATPYDLSTRGAPTAASSSTSHNYYGYYGACWSADGTRWYTVTPNLAPVSGSGCYLRSKLAQTPHSWSGTTWDTTHNTDASLNVDWPAGSLLPTTVLNVGSNLYLSPDGLHMFIATATGLIYQFGVRTKTMHQYEITFAQQSAAPTLIEKKPSTFQQQSFTPSFSNGSLVFTGNTQLDQFRAIQFKLDNNVINSTISQLRINLEKL
jgi:hypothetical protein